MRTATWPLLFLFACTLSWPRLSPEAHAQVPTGAIAGVVVELHQRSALAGAEVSVAGGSLAATTDASGRFQLLNVPAGEVRLVIRYLGYGTVTQDVRVEPGRTALADVEMGLSVATAVTVSAEPLFEGQARALNEQKNAWNIKNVVSADQIGRFPDPNAAEATQRIPGVTVLRDQGEGRYVIVRGTEPRVNATLINGERLPAPEGDLRQVALDVIPADLLETIEVTKALTPDMDADSIGGAVNLVTKQAPLIPRFSATLGGGGNVLTGGPITNFNATYGRRTLADRLGLVLSGSHFRTDRGSQNFEAEWDDGDLAGLELRDYTLVRTRWGLTTSLDYRVSPATEFFFRGIFNDYGDDEHRRAILHIVEDGEMERAFRERFEKQQVRSFMGGGRHVFDGGWSLDYRLTHAYAEEDEPRALESVFVLEDVEFDPVVEGDRIEANPANDDLDAYQLDEVESGVNFTSDRDLIGSFDVSRPFRFPAGATGTLQFGARFRDKHKMRDNTLFAYEAEDDFPLGGVIDPDFDRTRFLDGRYRFGAGFPAPGAAAQWIRRSDFEEEFDEEENLGDYTADESVQAGYLMTQLQLNDRTLLLPGVRFERSTIDYTAPEIVFDEDGDFVERIQRSGSNTYTNWLPGLHFRHRFDDQTNLRLAFTRSLARPNYSDLPPFELRLNEDREIARGNPNLKTTTSSNVDILGERYFASVGVVSGGFFYKRLANNIFVARTFEDIGGETFEVTQPQNGLSADLWGFEFAFQNRLSMLPGPWGAVSVHSNYTYAGSDATLPDRAEGPLPGQASHIGNLSVAYERGGFSGRLSWNYQGRLLEEVGEEADRDLYVDSRQQLDLSASQQIHPNLRIFFDAMNLTNRPYRRYEGVASRPVQEEYYRASLMGGLKIDF